MEGTACCVGCSENSRILAMVLKEELEKEGKIFYSLYVVGERECGLVALKGIGRERVCEMTLWWEDDVLGVDFRSFDADFFPCHRSRKLLSFS